MTKPEPGRLLMLAHLSLMDVAPPQFVRIAGRAGFDGVSIRLNRTSDGRGFDLVNDSELLQQTRRALDETGLFVWDTEVIRLRAEIRVSTHERLLAASAELGARYVITTIEIEDRHRASDSLGALSELAAVYGLTCAVEFMVFSAIRDLAAAVEVVTAAGTPGAVVLVDSLHLARSGGTAADVAVVPSALLAYAQLCDAAYAGPAHDPASAHAEAGRHRLLPGAGTLPLAALVQALPATIPIGIECPSAAGQSVDPQIHADAAFDAAGVVLRARSA